jgi:hypothetical protein
VLTLIKKIDVPEGFRADGIYCDAFDDRTYAYSHPTRNPLVISPTPLFGQPVTAQAARQPHPVGGIRVLTRRGQRFDGSDISALVETVGSGVSDAGHRTSAGRSCWTWPATEPTRCPAYEAPGPPGTSPGYDR